jgi:hypothetical protein
MTGLREKAIILTTYLILVIIVTWPTIKHLDDDIHFYNPVFVDQYVALWNFRNFQESLLEGKSPFETDRLFYPVTKSLGLYTPTYFYSLCSLPIQYLVPGVGGLHVSYNLFLMFSFLFSGFGVFMISRRFGLSPYAAFIAGIIFAYSGFRMTNLSQLNILSTEFVPFYLLGLILSFQKKGILAPLGTALAAVLLSYNSETHACGLGIMTVILIPVLLKGRVTGWWKRLALIGFIFVGLTIPLLWSVIDALRESDAFMARDKIAYYGLDVLALFWPNRFDSLWSFTPQLRPASALEKGFSFFLGIVPILLLCIAAIRGRHFPLTKTLWCMMILFFILALGPNLKIWGHITDITLPYHMLGKIFPFLFITRVPARFLLFVSLPLSLLAGYGAEILIRWSKNIRFRKPLLCQFRPTWFLSVLLIGILLFESVERFPLRTFSRFNVSVPKFYKELHSNPRDFAVLDLPYDGHLTRRLGMFYQAVHGKGILYATYPRAKRDNIKYFQESRLFRLLIGGPLPRGELEMHLSEIDLVEERKILRNMGIGVIVFHEYLVVKYFKFNRVENIESEQVYSDEKLPSLGQNRIDQLAMLENALSRAWGGEVIDFGFYKARAFIL